MLAARADRVGIRRPEGTWQRRSVWFRDADAHFHYQEVLQGFEGKWSVNPL